MSDIELLGRAYFEKTALLGAIALRGMSIGLKPLGLGLKYGIAKPLGLAGKALLGAGKAASHIPYMKPLATNTAFAAPSLKDRFFDGGVANGIN